MSLADLDTDGFYSFDTSSLLNGRRDLFPPDTFPTLWRNIEYLIAFGAIRSVDLVRDELAKVDDDVSKWARTQRGLFVPLTEDIQLAARDVLAAHAELIGVGSGRSGADPFVVALARARGGAVVTEEKARNNISNPKIPDVCDALGVPVSRSSGSSRNKVGCSASRRTVPRDSVRLTARSSTTAAQQRTPHPARRGGAGPRAATDGRLARPRRRRSPVPRGWRR